MTTGDEMDIGAKKRGLIFTIALNGYDRIFHKCIETQRAYCAKFGYEYTVVTEAPRGLTAAESAWLKIPLLLATLENGYEWVMFIDSDCEIRPHTPCFQTVELPNKYVYMAYGFSGRFNSGMIISRDTLQARSFLQTVLAHADKPVPPEDDAPWENGAVIHYGKSNPDVQPISQQWNNTATLDPTSFVQHYSSGILRDQYLDSPMYRLQKLVKRVRGKIARTLGPASSSPTEPKGALSKQLNTLMEFYRAKYPIFQDATPVSGRNL